MRRILLTLALLLLAGRAAHAGIYLGCTSCMPTAAPATLMYPSQVIHGGGTIYAPPTLTAAYPAPSYTTSYAPTYSTPLYAAPLYAAPLYAPAQAAQPIHLTLTAPTTPAPRAAATAPDSTNLDRALQRISQQMEQLAGVVEKHTQTLKDHEQRIQAVEKLPMPKTTKGMTSIPWNH